MESLEICPACGYYFEARPNRVWKRPWHAIWGDFPSEVQSMPSRVLYLVECPSCATAFPARTIQYFGWFSLRIYRFFVIGMIVSLVAAFVGLFWWAN
jgi:hypothetical protein